MKPTVVVQADITPCPNALDGLKEVAEVIVIPQTREALLEAAPKADAIFTCLRVRIDREIIDSAPKLKCVGTPSTGTDHLDLDALEERGIEMLCLKLERKFLDEITCTAELAWALVLNVARNIPNSVQAVHQGDWARNKFRGHQLYGQTCGILGYGRLGTILGRMAKGFGMKVLACDIKDFEAEGIERVDMDTLFRESDVVSLHIHLTPETKGLISWKYLEMMKPDGILVNTSRGAIVDEEALVEVMKGGHLWGYGTDVIHGEWMDDITQHPLVAYMKEGGNIVITPHIGGVTLESQSMSYTHTANKIRTFLEGQV
jgi:D-3-phosphoglycerate dehydrogenase / 2-oxoglutarate reductase